MIRMIEERTNMNIAEPLLPACPMESVCDNATRGSAVSGMRHTVSSAVQHRFTPGLHKLIRILHWVFHRVVSVLTNVAVPFARTPFVFFGRLWAIFVAALRSSRCLLSLPFPIPFGLLLTKLTLRINIQLLVNFLMHNVKNKEHQ